jgi:hypothetical protein
MFVTVEKCREESLKITKFTCVLLSIEDEATSFIFLLWSFEFTLSYIIGENELV